MPRGTLGILGKPIVMKPGTNPNTNEQVWEGVFGLLEFACEAIPVLINKITPQADFVWTRVRLLHKHNFGYTGLLCKVGGVPAHTGRRGGRVQPYAFRAP